jgi:4-hydroxy-tetrahydrodipicolinate reductase
MKLALVGYGKMGRMLERLAPGFGFEVALILDEFNNAAGAGLTKENFAPIDVAIEFSAPHVAVENIFRRVVREAARWIEGHPDYEAWGWEIHHSAKQDAPSGTLLRLVEDMRAAGYDRPIDTSSNRAGSHPGTHEIGFDSAADTLTLRHVARNREGFARGALEAARRLPGRRGVFEFGSILFAEGKE